MNTKQYLAIIPLLLSAMPLAADPEPDILRADLDGDGKQEIITWEQFAETEDDGEFYQIKVFDDDGSLLWEAPRAKDAENPLVFGNWHFGYSLPQIAADIDGDGAIELISPAPQGDVSPTCFRVLRWKGGRFVPVRSSILLETPQDSGRFPWSQSNEGQGTWISSFMKANPDGTFRVGVFRYVGESTSMGEAVVARTPKGFQFKKWAVPLKSLSGDPAAEPVPPAPAGGAMVYRARLSTRDHSNSAGKRLEGVGDILRQDRANYHKGKGDGEDGPDPLFGTPAARNGMDARKPVPVGTAAGALRKAIVSGTPLVEVEITDSELRVRILSK